MKFTAVFLIGSFMTGVLGCDHCPPSKDSKDVQGSSFEQSDLYHAQSIYADRDNNPDLNGYDYDSEYVTGAVDEDGDSGVARHQEYISPAAISSILGTELPFPADPVLSSIESHLLPTDAAFYSEVARVAGTNSGFLASVTGELAQATDAAGFSRALENVIEEVTSAASADLPVSTGASNGSSKGIAAGGSGEEAEREESATAAAAGRGRAGAMVAAVGICVWLMSSL